MNDLMKAKLAEAAVLATYAGNRFAVGDQVYIKGQPQFVGRVLRGTRPGAALRLTGVGYDVVTVAFGSDVRDVEVVFLRRKNG